MVVVEREEEKEEAMAQDRAGAETRRRWPQERVVSRQECLEGLARVRQEAASLPCAAARIGRALAYLERHYWKDPNGDSAVEHCELKHELEWLLVRTPASSPEGMIAKMECLMVGDADYGLELADVTNIESVLMLSVTRDLRAMTEAVRRGGQERTPAPSEAGGVTP